MIGQQFVHQRNQFQELLRRREQVLFLRREVNFDFGLKELGNLGLPCGQISLADGRRAIDPNAQSQRLLVLARERH